MNGSVIIIGGGLGGLVTGAILAKEGLSVTVVEKNSTVGGGLQSFIRFGEVFDTGMHVVGGMHEGGSSRRLFEYLGLFDRLHLKDVDPRTIDSIYFSEDGRRFRIAQGRDNFVKALAKEFPDQENNLLSYVNAMYKVAEEVNLFYLRESSNPFTAHSEDFLMAADAFISKYVTDDRLRSVLAYLNPFYGGAGGVTPAYIHSIISILYIEGPSRFAGGTCLAAGTLADFIKENGGTVLVSDAVAKVSTSDRMITGVLTEKGLALSADYYICAIHPCTFFNLLDDRSALPKLYVNRLDSIPNSYSAFLLNIKLKQDSFPYLNHSGYYLKHYSDMWKFNDPDMEWPLGFMYMTPPEIDQGEFSSKMIITVPMLWKEVKEWEDSRVGNRSEGYEEWKRRCADKVLDCMEEMFPGFREDCVEDVNTASPLTIRDYYGVKEGSMCGFTKDHNDLILSNVPVTTKIRNLFLTGQNCNLHGFCGVSLTAINTCEAILGKNYILDRINLSGFDDIRPYYDSEIPAAMQRIASDPHFPALASFVFPDMPAGEAKALVRSVKTVNDFQIKVMYEGCKRIIGSSISSFTYDGTDNIDRERKYLFVSNHRDIMLDATLLETILVSLGLDTTEITFGANLMQGELVTDIGKANKMFRVERPGEDIAAFYRSSLHLSEYIRSALTARGRSVWIANRNGRTKDGKDRTDPGIIKMFAMSRPEDRVRAIAELNVLPVSISYEWEPCDILKALELYARARGPYRKKEGEDLESILTGICQQKGLVHISICKPVTESELSQFSSLKPNDFYRKVADLLDRRICSAYRLCHNNYIAHDILHGRTEYGAFYSTAQRERFLAVMARLDSCAAGYDLAELKRIYLGIYANPVDSGQLFKNDEDSCQII